MTIKKQDGKFCVYSEDGSKKFGCYSTEESAKKRLSEIESFKDKKEKFSSGGIIEIKEIDGELVVKGYIATTHKDSVGDIILKETLEKWAQEINDGVPRANKVTYHHDREDTRRVGVGIKGTARVDLLPDGEYGLYVETVVNKAHDLFDTIDYEYKVGVLDSFSIEYTVPEGPKEEEGIERFLDTKTELYGWTLASCPANENAVMIKELFNTHKLDSDESTEAQQMTENKDQAKVIDALQSELKELKENIALKEEENAKQAKAEVKEKEEKEKAEAMKKMEEKEAELEATIKELKEAVGKISETKEAKLETENKEQKIRPEFKELKSKISNNIYYKELARHVGSYLEKRGISDSIESLHLTKENSNSDYFGKVSVGKVEAKEVMEFKGLSVGDNVNTNYINAITEIGLSQAELQDVVMPVIFNALNESTVTWDLLSKDSPGAKGTNRVTFVLKTDNDGAYFSKGNAITTTKTGREKYSVEYKKIYIGGSVDGDLQAYSRGSPFGEALSLEMADRAIAMKSKMNQALFDENAGNKADEEPLGIPAITDSAGNTSIYDTTRSSTNKLSPDSAADTYVDASGGLTEPMLRNMIEQATTDGSNLDDLVFVGTPAVINKYKALFDNKERLVPYSDKAGFKNAPEFEGVPFFSDKDSKASSLFLIDRQALRIAILVPPTPEMLGKRSDSVEFFMKSYYSVYCTAPRRLVEAYSIP